MFRLKFLAPQKNTPKRTEEVVTTSTVCTENKERVQFHNILEKAGIFQNKHECDSGFNSQGTILVWHKKNLQEIDFWKFEEKVKNSSESSNLSNFPSPVKKSDEDSQWSSDDENNNRGLDNILSPIKQFNLETMPLPSGKIF